MGEGKKPLQIYDYAEWDDWILRGSNLVIFIDDIFGEHSPSDVDVRQWSNRFRSIKNMVGESNNWNCLIMTLRTDILKQISLSTDSKNFLEDSMVEINVGGRYHLTASEKKDIYHQYFPIQNAPFTEIHSSTNLGFPQCCRMVASIIEKHPELRDRIRSLFANPKFLRDYILEHVSKGGMDIAVLVYVLFKGGSVKKTVLKDMNLDKNLKRTAMKIFSLQCDFWNFAQAISRFEGIFVIHNKQADTYTFIHSSIRINLFLEIGETHPLELLQNCTYDCLSMVTTDHCHSEHFQSLVIQRKYYDLLAKRIRVGMKEAQSMRIISELSVWKDEEFIDYYLQNGCGCQIHLEDDNGWSILVHFAIAENLKWVRHLCGNHNKQNKCVSESQGKGVDLDDDKGDAIAIAADEGTLTQIQLALTQACSTSNDVIVEYLLSVGGIPDISTCFYAVKAGHLNIIKILVQHGADLTQKHRSLSKWVTTTTVLEEAALQNQEHLMLPLLKCCPDLKKIRSSIGASAVHFAASAGDVQILEDLINRNEFTAYDVTNIGSTILHFACQNNRFDAVKHIVERYEGLFEDSLYCYEQGTVLHTAAQSGNVELFKYIFEKNMEYLDKCRQKRVTLLRDCYGRVNGKKCFVIDKEYLLQVVDKSGISLLDRAAQTGNEKLCKFILDNQVDDINLPN